MELQVLPLITFFSFATLAWIWRVHLQKTDPLHVPSQFNFNVIFSLCLQGHINQTSCYSCFLLVYYYHYYFNPISVWLVFYHFIKTELSIFCKFIHFLLDVFIGKPPWTTHYMFYLILNDDVAVVRQLLLFSYKNNSIEQHHKIRQKLCKPYRQKLNHSFCNGCETTRSTHHRAKLT